jgi:hypothetical protein
MISLLMGLGLFLIIKLIKDNRVATVLTLIVILIPFAVTFRNYKKTDMSRFTYADVYLENLFTAVTPDAIVMTQIDYFYFPAMYYQQVLNKRTDVVILDQPLLRRSWYIDMLKNQYPHLISASAREVEDFLEAVKPFENGEPYNGSFIEQKYIAMIQSFVDRNIDQGRDVFFTYIPSDKIKRNYYLESVFSAYRLNKTGIHSEVENDRFRTGIFKNISAGDQLLVRYMSRYFGELYFSRAILMESIGRSDLALHLYRECFQFYMENKRMIDHARERIRLITPSAD